VVDPFSLTSDILTNTISLALPPLVWALLFLLAFEHPAFAESVGFGRKAFWLLLPGSLLATFAVLPFAPISNDVIAISFGGALFPLLVGSLAVRSVAPREARLLLHYLLFVAIEGAVMLLLVLPLAAPIVRPTASVLGGRTDGATILLVTLVAALTVLIAGLVPSAGRAAPGPGASAGVSVRPLVFLVGLTSAILVGTFAVSSAIPGVGIVEPFPFYLLPPIAAGLFAVLLAPRVVPQREGFALPLAFLATTVGVLLGADLLREPPLYGSGPAGIYAIGGAGVLDVVYLSGLLALGTAFYLHRGLGRSFDPVGGPAPVPDPTPVGRLGRAFRAGVDGNLTESLSESSRAGHDAARQAGTLLGLAAPPADRPWGGLPVPGWVVSDQANLDAAARAGSTDGREGFRAWLTSRWLVYLGRDLGQRRFGTMGARSLGFVLDLIIVTIPAVAIWTLIALATPGDLDRLLSSLAFNAAIYGFISLAFLYLVLSETLTGRSLGKRGLKLVVRDRALRPIGFVSALLRNSTVLPILTVVGIAGAIGVAFALKAGSLSSVTIAGIPLPGGLLALAGVIVFLIAGVGLLGALALLVIALTNERQRLGDLLAGTWVVRDASPGFGGVPPGPASSSPPGPPPSA
jgi:uncharacterized membrane protein/uncharacterized RDD family membrane protein YckC